MRVVLNEQGYVEAYAFVGNFGTPSVIVDDPEDIEEFEKNYRSYYFSKDNKLVKSEDRQKEIDDKRESDKLRHQREKDCFSYVNRGTPWYNKLTKEQKEQLDEWYQAWLDVTNTKVIPQMLEWLK